MSEELKKKLFNQKKDGWDDLKEADREKVFALSKNYINFLNKAKTEREFIKEARKLADANGYKDIMGFDKLNPGDKVYFVNK